MQTCTGTQVETTELCLGAIETEEKVTRKVLGGGSGKDLQARKMESQIRKRVEEEGGQQGGSLTYYQNLPKSRPLLHTKSHLLFAGVVMTMAIKM